MIKALNFSKILGLKLSHSRFIILPVSITSIGNTLFAGTEHLGIFKLDTVITGVEKVKEIQNKVTIYPNPSTGQFNISFGATYYQQAIVEVFNIEGNLIITKAYQNSTKATIDITNNSKGMYLVKLICEGETHTVKICKD